MALRLSNEDERAPVETWLAFDCARDGRVLVATARGLHVFAPSLANEEAVEDHGLSLKAAALSNSGACLAASSENRLVAWRRDESWKPVALHHDCNRGYADLRWADEGRERLLCVSEDGAVRVLALERKGRDGPLALERLLSNARARALPCVRDVGSIS